MCTLLHTPSWLVGEPGAQRGGDLSCTGNGEKSMCCHVKLNLLVLRHHGFSIILPFVYRFVWWIFIPLTFDLALEVSSCRCS